MLTPLFADNTAGWAFGGLVCLGATVGLLVYILPTLIAGYRGHPNSGPIAVVNLLLGWSLVAWVVALAWAVSAIDRGPQSTRRSRDDDNPEYLDPRPGRG